MTELEERLQQRLQAATPSFEPVPLAAVADRVHRRRRAAGAVGVAGVVLAAGAAITVPRLILGGSEPTQTAAGAATADSASGGLPSYSPGAVPPAAGATTPGRQACPPRMTGNGVVDYVDFVEFGNRQYVRLNNLRDTVPRSALGRRLATVRCNLSEIQPDPDYHPKDGDSGYLPAGTPLYAITGYPPEDRLAALVDGSYHAYRVYPYTAKAG
jgi:hypothetical protein